jgi:D-tyrosyl-tRNA(Tyr) deacylase
LRLVVQRVNSARVEIDDEVVGEIKRGLLVFVGIEKNDGPREADFMAEKVLHLRIFPDENGKMNRSIRDINGEILSVSQFTLASHISKGRRPDFNNAEDPQNAEKLYDRFNEMVSRDIRLEKGRFGAMMRIQSVNDGPVTFIIEKKYENKAGIDRSEN